MLFLLGGFVFLVLVIYVIYTLAMLIPTIAVGIRRLHDTNKTGWLLLVGLVPFVGGIILIVFFAIAGDEGPNQYGEVPQGV